MENPAKIMGGQLLSLEELKAQERNRGYPSDRLADLAAEQIWSRSNSPIDIESFRRNAPLLGFKFAEMTEDENRAFEVLGFVPKRLESFKDGELCFSVQLKAMLPAYSFIITTETVKEFDNDGLEWLKDYYPLKEDDGTVQRIFVKIEPSRNSRAAIKFAKDLESGEFQIIAA